MSIFTTTVTVKTTIQSIMVNKPFLRNAVQYAVIVRSMGTATYVALGGSDSQDRQLKTVGDGVSLSTDMQRPVGRKWVNPAEMFCISDTSDAVLEIIGEAV